MATAMATAARGFGFMGILRKGMKGVGCAATLELAGSVPRDRCLVVVQSGAGKSFVDNVLRARRSSRAVRRFATPASVLLGRASIFQSGRVIFTVRRAPGPSGDAKTFRKRAGESTPSGFTARVVETVQLLRALLHPPDSRAAALA